MNTQRLLVGIDDTDNLDSPGSGTLAAQLAKALESAGLGQCDDISRHQLFVDRRIPYTSHNSAMCFGLCGHGGDSLSLVSFCQDFLCKHAAPGSDPGLCVAADDGSHDSCLVMFGRQAKERVLTKGDAYLLAREADIHLSEHGGSGGGVIGALAAVGLRLSGNDGRFRNWLTLGDAGTTLTALQLRRHPAIDAVCDGNGQALADDEEIRLGEDELKIVLRHGRRVLPVKPCNDLGHPPWNTLSRREMKGY